MTPSVEGIDVLISEVGPRDGLQNTKQFMPTTFKQRWISAAAAAGLREIEVCSFVPPSIIPQMVDAHEVVRHALGIPRLHVAVLAPNFKGVLRAIESGAHKITLPISVSRKHSLANVRRSTEEAIEDARRACAFRDSLPEAQRPKIEAGLSTVFGCTIEGRVSEEQVVRDAIACVEAGCDEVGLADTPAWPTRRRSGVSSARCARRSATGSAAPTCTTPAVSAWPTWSPHWKKTCAPSTVRSPVSAVVRSRRGPPATS